MSSNENVVLDNSQATLDSLSFKQEQNVDVGPMLLSLMVIILLTITALLLAKKRGINLVKKVYSAIRVKMGTDREEKVNAGYKHYCCKRSRSRNSDC